MKKPNQFKTLTILILALSVSCSKKTEVKYLPTPSSETVANPAPGNNSDRSTKENNTDNPRGITTSSGGDAIACYNEDKTEVVSVRLWDYVEAESILDRKHNTGTGDVFAHFQVLMDRFLIDMKDSLYETELKKIKKELKTALEKEKSETMFSFINGDAKAEKDRKFSLTPVDDSQSPIYVTEKFCVGAKEVQVASTDREGFTGRHNVKIDKFYFDKMPPAHQAALILHEYMVYIINKNHTFSDLLIEPIELTNTKDVRELISQLGADEFGSPKYDNPYDPNYDETKNYYARHQKLEQLGFIGKLEIDLYLDEHGRPILSLQSQVFTNVIPFSIITELDGKTIRSFETTSSGMSLLLAHGMKSNYYFSSGNIKRYKISDGYIEAYTTYQNPVAEIIGLMELKDGKLTNEDIYLGRAKLEFERHDPNRIGGGCYVSLNRFTNKRSEPLKRNGISFDCLTKDYEVQYGPAKFTLAKHSDIDIMDSGVFYPFLKPNSLHHAASMRVTVRGEVDFIDRSTGEEKKLGTKGKCTDFHIRFIKVSGTGRLMMDETNNGGLPRDKNNCPQKRKTWEEAGVSKR